MATITSSVGATGRNYATLDLWKASLPSDFVAAGNSYTAELYNDAAFSTWAGFSPAFILSGFTTDSTHFATITAAAGQAWCDNDVATSTSQTKGVYLSHTDHRAQMLVSTCNYTVISRLQIDIACYGIIFGASNESVHNCLIETWRTQATLRPATNTLIYDNVIIQRNNLTSNAFPIQMSQNGCEFYNNTIVRCSDYTAAGSAIDNHYARTGTIKNNAFFGYTTVNPTGLTGSNNATDQSSVGGSTSDLTSLTYASQFRTTTESGRDFRLATSGSSLYTGGVAVSGRTLDTFGVAIPQGTDYAIGAFQILAAAPARTGTISSTTKKLTASVSGAVGNRGTISSTTKKLTASVSGTAAAPSRTGTIAASIKKLTATVSGNSAIPNETGTIAATVKKLTASISGTAAAPNRTGTISSTSKKLTSSVSGTVAIPNETGTITASIKKLVASISGISAVPNETGTIAASLKKLTASLSGTSSLPNVTNGTISSTAKKLTASVSGSVGNRGTIAASVKKLTANVAGYVPPNETGTMSSTVKKLTADVTGKVGNRGTIAASTKKLTAGVSGTVSVPNVAGSITSTIKKLTSRVFGVVQPTSVITLPSSRKWVVRQEARNKLVSGTAPVSIFSRASEATYFDSTGTLQTAAVNVERIGYDPVTLAYLGPVLEQASTNYVRNPRAQGAVAGTPGTGPTFGWVFGSAGGVARQIVGTGTINGIPYFDVRMFGTVTTAAQLYINHTFDSGIPCTVGRVFTASVWLQLIADAGTYRVPNYTFTMPQTPSTSYYTLGSMSAASLATWSRRVMTGTSNNASMTAIGFSLWSSGSSSVFGNYVDITFRMGLPQFEFGNTATSIIMPPVGLTGISTRSPDFLRVLSDRNRIVASESRYHIVG